MRYEVLEIKKGIYLAILQNIYTFDMQLKKNYSE